MFAVSPSMFYKHFSFTQVHGVLELIQDVFCWGFRPWTSPTEENIYFLQFFSRAMCVVFGPRWKSDSLHKLHDFFSPVTNCATLSLCCILGNIRNKFYTHHVIIPQILFCNKYKLSCNSAIVHTLFSFSSSETRRTGCCGAALHTALRLGFVFE